MSKQIKKPHQKREKRNPLKRTCEQCGNDGISRNKVFKCKYCGYINGLPDRVEITRGRLEE